MAPSDVREEQVWRIISEATTSRLAARSEGDEGMGKRHGLHGEEGQRTKVRSIPRAARKSDWTI